jgi:hypothetical protein
VSIVANAPASGKVFDKWTATSGTIADASSASTTFTMPAGAVTVTATYKDAPATTYVLTVTSGTGGGSYEVGAVVSITASTPASGKVFDKWTATSGTIADAGSASTTFTMPAGAATVTATYKDAPAATYALTVTSGTGSGSYEAGAVVSITANAPASGKVFDKWTATSGTIADASSASTTFTMPAGAVTVTATYKDAPAVKTALTAKIADAEAKANDSQYTEASRAALQTAINSAKDVANDPAATQAAVDSALSALNSAISALQQTPPPPVVDTTKYLTIMGKETKYEDTPLNWFLLIVCFGWIWMWFAG